MKIKNINKGTLIFLIIIGLTILFGIISFIKSKSKNIIEKDIKPKFEFNTTENIPDNIVKIFNNADTPKFPKKDYIARIQIKGVITEEGDTYNQSWLTETINKIKDDKNNKGIILSINSPGGGLYESDETYIALLDYKTQTNRPIYTYCNNIAASGGYYIACASDYIMANRNSFVGSIGVICGQFIDVSELMQKHGIKMKTIHSGRNKIMGSINLPLTKEQEEIMQTICDEGYDQFVKVVCSSRKMQQNEVVEIADGRIFTAKQCLENNLIDEIGTMKDLENTILEKEFENANYEIVDYSYTKPNNFYSMIRGAAKDFSKTSFGNSFLPKIIEDKIENKIPFPAYYCDIFN